MLPTSYLQSTISLDLIGHRLLPALWRYAVTTAIHMRVEGQWYDRGMVILQCREKRNKDVMCTRQAFLEEFEPEVSPE